MRVLTVDVLHTLHLGIFADWCKQTVWCLLDASVRDRRPVTAEEKHQVCILCMRNELGEFYTARRQSHPDETLTRANDLTVKLFGSRNEPALKMSGAETWGFMLYLLSALKSHGPSLPPLRKRLFEAGQRLEHIYSVMQEHGHNLPKTVLQDTGWARNSQRKGP